MARAETRGTKRIAKLRSCMFSVEVRGGLAGEMNCGCEVSERMETNLGGTVEGLRHGSEVCCTWRGGIHCLTPHRDGEGAYILHVKAAKNIK